MRIKLSSILDKDKNILSEFKNFFLPEDNQLLYLWLFEEGFLVVMYSLQIFSFHLSFAFAFS
jgi:hypothetical protein